MAWERRVTSSQGMEGYDSGAARQPIALVHVRELDQNKMHLIENELIRPSHFGVAAATKKLFDTLGHQQP